MNRLRIEKVCTKVSLWLMVAGAATFLSSCAQPIPSTTKLFEQQQVGREASLLLRPHIVSGKFKTLAIVENYTKESVDHLVIKVFRLEGSREVPVVDGSDNQLMADLANSQLDAPITFSHLTQNTTYRVRAFAYKAPGTAASDLISTLDAESYTDIPIGTDDRPTAANLRVKLIDVLFNGQGSAPGTLIEDGGFSSKGPMIVEKGPLAAQVTTFAGTGNGGLTDGATTSAEFMNPSALATDALGTVYVADSRNHCIRKITPDGMVSTLAGTGDEGYIDGPASVAQFYCPSGIAVDAQGTIYIADTANHRIRRLTPDGQVSTFAGTGFEGFKDGAGTVAQFYLPSGLDLDASGNLYVADTANHRVRKVTTDGTVSTVAGSGLEGYAPGIGTAAAFNNPFSVTVDAEGVLYVADTWNNRIRKVLPDGTVLDVAGDGNAGLVDGAASTSRFSLPASVAVAANGRLYVADAYNNCVRKIAPDGIVSTVAGSGFEGYINARGNSAAFDFPFGIIAIEQGFLVSDYNNHAIRHIAF